MAQDAAVDMDLYMTRYTLNELYQADVRDVMLLLGEVMSEYALGAIRLSILHEEKPMHPNAHLALALVGVLDEVVDMTIKTHAKGEHVTFGQVAETVAEHLPSLVEEAGLNAVPWKLAPPRHKDS